MKSVVSLSENCSAVTNGVMNKKKPTTTKSNEKNTTINTMMTAMSINVQNRMGKKMTKHIHTPYILTQRCRIINACKNLVMILHL